MDSSASVSSRNADWTRSTTLFQLSASVYICAAEVSPFSVLPALSVVVASSFSDFSFYFSFSYFRAVASHLLRCSALIPDAPPER